MDQQTKHDIDRDIKKSETEIIKKVEDMYWSGGISTPIKAISELLNVYFMNSETDTKDNSVTYQFQNSEPKYVQDIVYNSLEIIQFCANVFEEYAKLDDLKRRADIIN